MAEGLSDVVPLAEVDVNVPGVIVMLVAPEVDQLSVLLAPALMLAGLAAKDVIVGAGVCEVVGVEDPPQPARTPPRRTSRMTARMPI
ncbi:MAG TPA: hypothetical protein VKR52_05430 [Terracidiphilus sp.]|nr:hypothetical protein [Terracidiphilus sp.]